MLISSLFPGLATIAFAVLPGNELERPPKLENTWVSAAVIAIDEPWVILSVSEAGQGQTDLNGDGDTRDRVLQLLHLENGRRRNLGLHAYTNYVGTGSGLALFGVDERSQGARDLNQDGDTGDAVVHATHLGTATSVNLGLAMNPNRGVTAGADWLSFLVYESDAGERLNDDADQNDFVLHSYHVPSARITNHRVSVQRFGTQPISQRHSQALVAVSVGEAQEGQLDRNGDGDRNDSVLAVFDLATGSARNLGLAVAGLELRSPEFLLEEGLLACLVPEQLQTSDLNLDGDLGDRVPHVYDATDGSITNLGWATVGGIQLDPPFVAFRVREQDAGDLNGDGDTADAVAFLYDSRTKQSTNLAQATGSNAAPGSVFQLAHGLLALEVSEAAQGGMDLNGDGDALDPVLHLVTPGESAPPRNLRLAVSDAHIGPKLVAAYVDEALQNNADANGDGDSRDQVFHAYERATGVLRNSHLAGRGDQFVTHTSLGHAYFHVSEHDQGADLNENGSSFDRILFRSDGKAYQAFLEMANAYVIEGPRGGLVMSTSELFAGRDFNGDGDQRDQVPFLFGEGEATAARRKAPLQRE